MDDRTYMATFKRLDIDKFQPRMMCTKLKRSTTKA